MPCLISPPPSHVWCDFIVNCLWVKADVIFFLYKLYQSKINSASEIGELSSLSSCQNINKRWELKIDSYSKKFSLFWSYIFSVMLIDKRSAEAFWYFHCLKFNKSCHLLSVLELNRLLEAFKLSVVYSIASLDNV